MIDVINQFFTPIVMDRVSDYFFGSAGFGFFSVVWFAFLILGLVLCVWIFADANSRGMRGGLWVLALLVGSFFWLGWLAVLVVYLLVRGSAHGRPIV